MNESNLQFSKSQAFNKTPVSIGLVTPGLIAWRFFVLIVCALGQIGLSRPLCVGIHAKGLWPRGLGIALLI